jgi:hypothetical protein
MHAVKFMTGALVLLIGSAVCEAGHSISRDGDTIQLEAGCLGRAIRVSGSRVILDGLGVDGTPVAAANSGEISFAISLASPNRDPRALIPTSGGAINVEAGQQDGTDSLEVREKCGEPDGRQTEWTGKRSFAGNSWQDCFDLTRVAITSPRPGVQRLVVRTRALKDPALAGVSVTLVYEIYDGFPVIRKWAEFQNNSASWIKLDELVIDDMRVLPEFADRTLLTPSERGAGSSIVAFSNREQTRGMIVASEIPSALRRIQDDCDWGCGCPALVSATKRISRPCRRRRRRRRWNVRAAWRWGSRALGAGITRTTCCSPIFEPSQAATGLRGAPPNPAADQ